MQHKPRAIFLYMLGKAKLVFTKELSEDYSGRTAVCYNHIWETISEQKAPLMDCFSTSPKNTHKNDGKDSIISVSYITYLYIIPNNIIIQLHGTLCLCIFYYCKMLYYKAIHMESILSLKIIIYSFKKESR